MTTATIPDTQEGLLELLADDKRRVEVFATAKGASEFQAAYAKAVNRRDKGDLNKQLSDAVAAGFTEFAKTNNMAKLPGGVDLHGPSEGRISVKDLPSKGTGAQRAAAHNPNAFAARLDGVFDSLGSFASTIDIKNVQTGGRRNPDKYSKVMEVSNAYSSFDPASAGFLIPEEFRSDIMGMVLEQAIVRPRATVIPMSTQTLSLPFVDETTHVGSVYGGMVFTWTAEGGTISPTEAKFGRVRLEANKLTGGARVPNELMADAPALTGWINRTVPQGLAFYEDLAFLTGDGGMQPLGVFNSPALVSVSKETGQLADTIVVDNIFKMYSRMLPSSLSSAVWLVNQTTLPQLLSLSIAVGTGGAPVMLVNIQASPNLTILGRPVIVTEKAATVGDVNDIVFADLGYYLIGDRQALSMESSEHSRFMSDETEIRVIERADGRPWVQSALTPLNGLSVSPFVNLAERA
jgi:HK97 family phage major capsid protein